MDRKSVGVEEALWGVPGEKTTACSVAQQESD